MMDFLTLAQKRQSVRAYSDRKVTREDIEKCLQAARLAPSACNSQPWKMVVVDEPETLVKVAEQVNPSGTVMNKFARQVPVLVAVVEEEAVLMKGAEDKKMRWVGIDNGSAIEHFCLQAAELGLGTCIMGAFNEEGVKTVLEIPSDRSVKIVIALGYPENDAIRPKVRRELSQLASYNRYQ